MEHTICQSCGMPMAADAQWGSEADGSPSRDYCSYCYQQGAFTMDGTIDQMIELCLPYMAESNDAMTEDQARAMMRQYLPHLKRWAKA